MPKTSAESGPRDSPSSGFTLIEVLVALTIAALGLGSLMLAARTGLGNADVADRYIDATRRAQSRLTAVGLTSPLLAGEQSGDDGAGYSWRVRISQPALHAIQSAQPAQMPLGLYTIDVTLSWRSGTSLKSVTLQSERVAHVSNGK